LITAVRDSEAATTVPLWREDVKIKMREAGIAHKVARRNHRRGCEVITLRRANHINCTRQ